MNSYWEPTAMLDPLLQQFREETKSPHRPTLRGGREIASNSQRCVPQRKRSRVRRGQGDGGEGPSEIQWPRKASLRREHLIWKRGRDPCKSRDSQAKRTASQSHGGRDVPGSCENQHKRHLGQNTGGDMQGREGRAEQSAGAKPWGSVGLSKTLGLNPSGWEVTSKTQDIIQSQGLVELG